MREHDFGSFLGKRYTQARFIRMLFIWAEWRFVDSRRDWAFGRSMSRSLSLKVKQLGCWTFGEAVRSRDTLRLVSGNRLYSFADL
eukprot:900720-Karenia_brevis.AAC.1